MKLSINDVNRKYSFTWIKCNDDAQSPYFRGQFLQKHGGVFEKINRNWIWISDNTVIPTELIEAPKLIVPPHVEVPILKSQKEACRTIVLKDSLGVVHNVKNIQQFCRDQKLIKSGMYKLISGKKKAYKGFTYIETLPI